MSGAIARRTNETSKALGGKVSYAWATLAVFARWKAGEVVVEVGGERREGRMHDVIVANGRYLGGGMMLTPEAEPDDGLLDVLLIGDLTKRDLVLTMPKTYRGKHLPHPKAELLRGTTATIEAPRAAPGRARRRAAGDDARALRDRPRRAEAARARRQLALRVARRAGARRRRARRLRLGFGFAAGFLRGAGGFATAGFLPCSSLTRCSSSATRFSSASRPRRRFCMSSIRSRIAFAASAKRPPPGASASREIASSPRSASLLKKSCPPRSIVSAFPRMSRP